MSLTLIQNPSVQLHAHHAMGIVKVFIENRQEGGQP